jgi:uncharacterized membrane protein YdbT with pleckstrin-like domain
MNIVRPNEKIVLEVRRHWFALLRGIIVTSLLILAPFIIIAFLQLKGISLAALGLVPLAVFLISSWTLLVWTFFYITWTDYYLDVLIMTDQRLIDIEQKGLFAREISELRLENIQDVKVEIHGFLETLFDFGNIHIQTAGAVGSFTAHTVPKPNEIKDIILNRYDALKHQHLQNQ